jgi:hypothetical protein
MYENTQRTQVYKFQPNARVCIPAGLTVVAQHVDEQRRRTPSQVDVSAQGRTSSGLWVMGMRFQQSFSLLQSCSS